MATQIQETLSSGPSMWLRLIAWVFKLSGFLFFVMAILAVVAYVADVSPPSGNPSFGVTLLSFSAMSGALLLTGILLARRARAGAYMALIVTLYPLAFILAGWRPLSWTDVIVTLVTVAVVASIWPQLSSPRASTAAK
ncbi:MAG: hypothetical protein M3P26_03035 [Gemmatimonadota bacterium]|nr:hypothetical protein [Gemmatimonadota bacterium]